MGKGPELAKAYVQIVPSAKGIKGKISEQMGGEADTAGKTFGSRMVGAIKGIVAAAAIGKAISASINEGAALQQSLGGVETLFKDSADKVKENAAKAFKTAGMSANEYMEMTTSFAASLLSSLGNDTAKAADVADMAMVDMSDNANKMGTSMELIQNAYQGFAKQNYTMLDNLKLGYGGTKTEMERLLADAQKITGVKYDINNLSDVYSAIHVIQGELGITGTTAKEASETFSGSFAAMKAAAKNLMGNLALGNDIQKPLFELQETVHTFFVGNFLPMIGNVIKGVPALIEQGLTMMTLNLNLAASNADQFVEQGIQLITSLVTGIVTGVPYLVEAAWNLISAFGLALIETDWISVAQNLITNLRTGLDDAAGQILGTDGNIIGSVVNAITSNLPSILQQGIEIVTNILNGILSGLSQLIRIAGVLLTGFIDKIQQLLPSVLQSGIKIVVNIVEGILSNIPEILLAAGTLITDFANKIIQLLPTIINAGAEMLVSVVNGIIEKLPQIISAAVKVIADFLSTIGSKLPSILQQGIEIIGKLAAGLIKAIPDLTSKIPEIIRSIVSEFQKHDWLQIGKDIIRGIASGLKNAGHQLWDAVKGILGNFKDQVLSFFGIHSPSRWGIWVGEMIDKGFANGIEGNIGPIKKAVGIMETTVTKPFESNFEYSGRTSTGNVQITEILYAILSVLETIASKNTDLKMYFKDREVGRALREMGVVFET